jgi:uncharacterized protein (DUF1810 family)
VTDADLIRFVSAQTNVYGKVIEELTDGCKRTHWMWFTFPQLSPDHVDIDVQLSLDDAIRHFGITRAAGIDRA